MRIFRWIPLLLVVAMLLWASGIAPSAYNLIISGATSLPSRTVLKFVNGGCADNSGTTPPETDCTIGGTLYSQTNTVTDAVQTTETSLFGTGSGTNVLPANFYGVGTTLKFEASGFYSTTGAPGTLTIRVKHTGGATGTVVIGNTGAITPIASVTNGVWRLWGNVTFRTTGAGGTGIMNTVWETEPSSLSTLTPANASITNTTTFTVDTTATQTVDLTAVWSAAGQTISCTNLTLFSPNGANNASGGGGFIQTLTAPVAANFTAENFNTGAGVVTTQVNDTTPVTSITLLQHDPSNTLQIVALDKAKLAATFTETIALAIVPAGSGNQAVMGLFFTDGTNVIIFGYQSGGGFNAPFFTNINGTFSAFVFTFASNIPNNPLTWLRIQETASNRIYSVSSSGKNGQFAQVFSEANTAHFTTTRYGIAVENRGASAASPDVMTTWYSFTESNP